MKRTLSLPDTRGPTFGGWQRILQPTKLLCAASRRFYVTKCAIFLQLFLVMGCQGISVENIALIASSSVEDVIVGAWEKAPSETGGVCEQQYPNQLEFFDNGIYMISQADAKNDDFYLQWQSGDYWFEDDGQLYIQNAMDAMLAYEVSVVDGGDGVRLVFVDGEGCEFAYVE